jgi:hypothetical protein
MISDIPIIIIGDFDKIKKCLNKFFNLACFFTLSNNDHKIY